MKGKALAIKSQLSCNYIERCGRRGAEGEAMEVVVMKERGCAFEVVGSVTP